MPVAPPSRAWTRQTEAAATSAYCFGAAGAAGAAAGAAGAAGAAAPLCCCCSSALRCSSAFFCNCCCSAWRCCFENFGIGRLAVERRPKILQRDVEGQLAARRIAARNAQDNREVLAFLQVGERGRADFDLGGAGVLEAHVVLAVEGLGLVDDDAEAGLDQHADRQHHEAQLLLFLALKFEDLHADHRSLVGRRRKIAHRLASLTTGRLLLAAQFDPLRLRGNEVDLGGDLLLRAGRGLSRSSRSGWLRRRALRQRRPSAERQAHCERRSAHARDREIHQSSFQALNHRIRRPLTNTRSFGVSPSASCLATVWPGGAAAGRLSGALSFHIQRDNPITISRPRLSVPTAASRRKRRRDRESTQSPVLSFNHVRPCDSLSSSCGLGARRARARGDRRARHGHRHARPAGLARRFRALSLRQS